MIESSSDNISILYPDGSSIVFDGAELRQRLERACIQAERADDLSIAEDVALAVEFGLRSGLRESGAVSVPAEELERAVAKSLEDAGYAQVAEKFLSGTGSSPASFRIAPGEVKDLLARALSLSGQESGILAETVNNALRLLGFDRCSPRFVLELAKEFRSKAAAEAAKEHSLSVQQKVPSVLIPSAEERVKALPEKFSGLFRANAVRVRESTRLFPSVRVEISLENLLSLFPAGGDGDLTELSLAPVLAACAEAVDAVYEQSVKKIPSGKLPLVITFSDIPEFVSAHMLLHEQGNPERCARSLGAYFKTFLKVQPFRIRYGR